MLLVAKYVVDTSSLMNNPDIIDEYPIVIIWRVLKELNQHKDGKDENKRYLSRQALRKIDNSKTIEFDFTHYHQNMHGILDPSCSDDQLIQCCLNNEYGLVTDDVGLKQKAKGFHIKVLVPKQDDLSYGAGYVEVNFSDHELAKFYESKLNSYGLKQGQYLIIRDESNKYVETYLWDGIKFKELAKRPSFDSVIFGKIKHKDPYQLCAMDALVNKQFVAITGSGGTGKSLLALSYAFHAMREGKYNKLVVFYNPVDVRNSGQMGYNSGDRTQKLMQKSLGSMLQSKFGNMSIVNTMIAQNELLLLPTGDIRGFETPECSILWIPEAQNLDRDLAKVCVQRLSETSKLIMEGDIDHQVDHKNFEGRKNGFRAAIKLFSGQDMFAHVHLPKIYRSRIAEIADKL